MPGPIAVVWFDFVVSELQIDLAAALGASAITLHGDYTDNLAGLVAHSKARGVEPIVQVESLDAARAALGAGARCLCFQTLEDNELVEARATLEAERTAAAAATDATMYIARLRPESDFSAYAEIDSAWLLRDGGFHCVWPSADAVYATGMSDIYTTVLAMRSKASRLFISPRQFLMDRLKEGAKEYLGDILY